MIKKLIARYRDKKLEKELNKPKYFANDLYVGKLIHLVSQEFIGDSLHTSYYIKKKYAIVTYVGFDKYYHLNSNQYVRGTLSAPNGDIAIDELKSLCEKFPLLARRLGLHGDTKLSLNMIKSLEEKLNDGTLKQFENLDNFSF